MLQFKVGSKTDTGIGSVIIQHGKSEIEYYLNSFERTRIFNRDTIFETLNGYLETLPAKDQDILFDVYEDILDYIQGSSAEVSVLLLKLKEKINVMFDVLNLEALQHYCRYSASFSFPTTLKNEYSEAEPKESTYIKSDYFGLLILSTVLKAILPVWGELIKRTKNDVGSTFKEQICVLIMGESQVFSLAETRRLCEYVRAMSEKIKIKDTAIYNHIGSEQLPDWLLGLAMVRRLAISETNIADVNLISNIYNFINSIAEKMDSRFNSKVQSKRGPKDSSTGEEDNISIAENYKIKQEVADNYIVTYEVYSQDYENLALTLMPSLDLELLRSCHSYLANLEDFEFDPWRIQLISLMVGNVISQKSLHCLTYSALIKLLAVTQAILLTLGFEDIAHLLTARREDIPLDLVRGDGSRGAERSRVTNDNKTRLFELYKFARGLRKLPEEKRKSNTVPLLWIEVFNRETQGYDWFLNSAINPTNQNYKNGRRWYIPKDIKNQLAELIIKIKGEGVLDVR